MMKSETIKISSDDVEGAIWAKICVLKGYGAMVAQEILILLI